MRWRIINARLVTIPAPPGGGAHRGRAMREIGVVERADVLIEGGVIREVAPRREGAAPPDDRTPTLDARGRVVAPGLVDCHTHACFAGDRLGEWEMKLAGAAYLDILRAGGGIMSTVRAVRAASAQQLVEGLLERLDQFLRQGTTTVEIKSGYGLSTADELKMLRAIRAAALAFPGTIRATALLGHAVDGEPGEFVARTIRETLESVHEEFPGIAVDAFCEKGAWSLEDCRRLFERARELGHPIRVHADQFTSLGMTPLAVALGAASVDHLEATTEADLAVLAGSATIGVGLPCTGLHLANRSGGAFADLRRLVDLGGAAAIATNCNPGSSPTASMALAMGTAVRFCGLTPAEAWTAATANGAAVLGLADRGRIAPGMRADLVVLRHTDERAIAFELGGTAAATVACAGRVVVGEGPRE